MDERYRVFEALSHPTRVKILKLVGEKALSFSSLKHELEIESSGQLQHHLQKLTGLIATEKGSGSYALTGAGRQALNIYDSSEKSGRSLEAVCCLPTHLGSRQTVLVGRTGSALRFAFAGILLALTAALVVTGQTSVKLSGSSVFVGFGLSAAIIAAFFGISFLIAGLDRHPGCEIMAIPNLFAGKSRYYCSCLITPFNLPDGRLLEHAAPSRRVGDIARA